MPTEPPHSSENAPGSRRGPRFADSPITRLTVRALRALATCAMRIAQVLLALVIVFEEWGWRPLAAALAQLARLKPIAWIETRIRTLPPYGALLVFGAPSLLILPLKLAAVYLIASGHTTEAAALFIGAKIVGTAIVARLFQLTETQLLQIPWFARAYGVFMPWKDALVAWVHNSWPWRYARVLKERVHRVLRPLVQTVRASVGDLVLRLRGWLGRKT